MQVASLELSKQLLELSGWQYDSQSNYNGVELSNGKLDSVPAYDLGYLLRMLPTGCYIATRQTGATASTGNAFTYKTPYGIIKEKAETPEDAVCKLAIELFKQGVLKRES